MDYNPFKENDNIKEGTEVRPVTLHIMLICGIIIIITGIVLYINHDYAYNNTMPGKQGYGGPGKPVALNGLSVVLIGWLVCAYPIYTYLKKIKKRE